MSDDQFELKLNLRGPCLNLGCGNDPVAGATNHDLSHHSDHVDVAHDLDSFPWPWRDGTFDAVFAIDVFEHLRSDADLWLNECHRIISSGGSLICRVPHYSNENAYTDPTHRRFFTVHTFDYWDRSRLLHQKYGCFYYKDAARWWEVKVAKTDNVNILFHLAKEGS